jgi:hypothetical protein
MNKKGEFEYEPMPSSRTEAFFKRCRFTLDEAKKILESDKAKGAVSKLTKGATDV